MDAEEDATYKMSVRQVWVIGYSLKEKWFEEKRKGNLYTITQRLSLIERLQIIMHKCSTLEKTAGLCDQMLREQDLCNLISFDDLKRNIALGSHDIDFHIYGHLPIKNQEYNQKVLFPSGIPNDCILPKRFNNVPVAYRAYGASHIAFTSRQVNKDKVQLGWVAGDAVKYCLNNSFTGSDVLKVNLKVLQSKDYTQFKDDIEHIDKKL